MKRWFFIIAAFATLLIYLYSESNRSFLQKNKKSSPAKIDESQPSISNSELNQENKEVDLPKTTKIEAAPTPLGLTGESLAAMRELLARFNTGDYGACLELSEKHLKNERLSPIYHQWVRNQMPAILTSQGWLKLQLGKCQEAIPLFEKSFALDQKPETVKGLAICYFKIKQLEDADSFFARYVKTNTADLEMKILYADLLETMGDFEGSLNLLDDVSKRPLPKDKLQYVNDHKQSMKGKVAESALQTSTSSNHIILTYRGEEHEPLVDLTLETLENALVEYKLNWGLKTPTKSIEVVLYPDQSFQSVVTYGPRWAQGIYDGRVRIPIHPEFLRLQNLDILKRTLRHEITHAILAENVDRRPIPTWFNEGLAQYFECPNGCTQFAMSPGQGKFLSMADLEDKYVKLDAAKAQVAYRQCLFLVQTLVRLPNGQENLRNILESLNISSKLTSDDLLKPANNLTFKSLHQQASARWK